MSKILNREFPALLGLLIIIVGILVTTFLVKSGNLFQTKAGPTQNPKDVRITNVTDTSFTVSYTTDDKVIGTLNLGTSENNLDQTILDDRDQLSQAVNAHNVHYITAKGLDPETKYFFKITSGTSQFDNNGSDYFVVTGSTINTDPPSQNPISGNVVQEDSSPLSEGIAYVSINGAEDLSTLVKSAGNYILPLNSARTNDLTNYFTFDDNSIINIEIQTPNQSSSVSVSQNQINPVPLITISNNYDFSSPITPSPTENSAQTSFSDLNSIKGSSEPIISIPSKNQEFNSQRPQFKGMALANEIVEISIHSDEKIKTQVSTDGNGNWTFTPPNPLSEGNHTITISSINSSGIVKNITQNFSINSSAPNPSVTQTPEPTQDLTPTPTEEVITPTASLTPAPTLPPTGSSSVIMTMITALFTTFVGITIFLLTRNKKFI